MSINYTEFDRPYDNELNRAPDDSSGLSSSDNMIEGPDTASGSSTGGYGGDYGTPVTGNGKNPNALPPGGLGSGDFSDIFIENWIKSRNYYPKKGGFYIDGKTGYAEFSNVYVSGTIIATVGEIGGWVIGDTFIRAGGTSSATADMLLDSLNKLIRVGAASSENIIIDGQNLRIRSSNYVSGPNGSGFTLEPDLLEVGNISARGIIRTAVFQKDIVSANAGSIVVVPNSDVLDVDMDATDTMTMTTKGTAAFAVNDRLRIKDTTADEWFIVTDISSAPTYVVTRDAAGSYSPNANPQWKQGATIIDYGPSGAGGIYLTASDTNSPYLSLFTHAGSPWSTLTTQARLGNLNGYLDYVTNIFGLAVGSSAGTNANITIDPVNGLRIRTGTTNAITLDNAGNASFSGVITAIGGYIGGVLSGWNITTGKIYGGSGSAFSGLIQGTGSTKSFFAGATDDSGTDAQFYVTAEGDLVANSATISGYKLFEAVVATDGSGDYTSVTAALAAGKKRIFVRNGTYTGESRWTMSTAGMIIQGESKDGVNITFAEDNTAHPAEPVCIAISKPVTLSTMSLNSYDFSGSDVKVFDTFPNRIDTAKWTETDPSGLIAPRGASSNGVTFTLPHTGTINLFNTKLQSIASVTSGLAVFQSEFQWTDGGTNEAIVGIGLYVDNNNYAFFESRSGTADLVRLVIVQGGVQRYNFTTSFVSFHGSWKITYDTSSKDIKFWLYDGGWTQQGTTQNYNLGTTVYAMATFSDSAAYTNADNIYVDGIYLTNSDYTTTEPFVQQTLISTSSTDRSSFLDLNVKNNRGRIFSNQIENFCTVRNIYFNYLSNTDPNYSYAFYGATGWDITSCYINATTLPMGGSNITFFDAGADNMYTNIRVSSGVNGVIWRIGNEDNAMFTNCIFTMQELSLKSNLNGCTLISTGNAPSGYFISLDDGNTAVRNCFITLDKSYDLLEMTTASNIFSNNQISGGKKIYLNGFKTMQFVGNVWTSSYTAAPIDLELSGTANKTIVTNNTFRNNTGGGFTPTITDGGSSTVLANNVLIH